MLTNLQCWILNRISPGDPGSRAGVYESKSKLKVLLGEDFLRKIVGRDVVDFGCGRGSDSIEMAQVGAHRVTGIDIREEVLELARRNAESKGVSDVCKFALSLDSPAEIVVSLDAFEHFSDPAAILRVMNSLLKADGEIFISFGPTWYHPLGGHEFSIFPWAHILFSEDALIRWRSRFKTDGATRFSEVSGGLNQMTIGRFQKLIEDSDLKIAEFRAVPIRKLGSIHNRWTREFLTAVVRCRLVKRTSAKT